MSILDAAMNANNDKKEDELIEKLNKVYYMMIRQERALTSSWMLLQTLERLQEMK